MRNDFRLRLFLALLGLAASAWAATPQVGGGEGFSCAMGPSGRVFCWGSNSSGQIGNGAGMLPNVGIVSRPVEMAGGFVTISSGGSHSCGLQADGSAYCWGENHWGELGTGSTDDKGVSLPVRVASPVPFQSISSGATHTCALDRNGLAWCWGNNSDSQLGNDPRGQVLSSSPIRVVANVPGNTQTFKSISAGDAHTCAIDTSDEAWCWGSNVGARAGIDINLCGGSVAVPCNFYQPQKTIASQAPASLHFKAISAGALNTCAVDTAGNVQCWGQLFRGQAPIPGQPAPRPDTPAQVGNVVNAVSVSAGASSVCAVAGDGGLFCWGKGDFGQLGDGRTPMPTLASATPVRVSGAQDYLSVSVGAAQACARSAGNVVRCWGNNDHSQLGVAAGGATKVPVPNAISGLESTLIATGSAHACSLDPSGVSACWGDNLWGQVGHGRAGTIPHQSVVPTPVARFYVVARFRPFPTAAPAPPEQLSNTIPAAGKFSVANMGFSRLAVGAQHVCVLNAAGIAYCWGADFDGQVGNGNRATANCRFSSAGNGCVPAPTIVSRATGDVFTNIAAGVTHNCALDRSAFVRCWGSAGFGELGSPVTCANASCFRRQPALIQMPFPIRPQMRDVAGGDSSTCGVNISAQVFCWGFISHSQVPVQMPYPNGPDYERIGTGSGFACAGVHNGAIQCFGDNSRGQLGDGSNTNSTTPTLVSNGLFPIFAVSRDFGCGFDIGAEAVECWGANGSGQLGDTTTNPSNVPVQVSLSAGFTAVGIGTGFNHACAITTNADVRCWGSNAIGQLGDGNVVNGPGTQPVAVAAGWRIP